MIVKKVLNESVLTLAEVKEILTKARGEEREKGVELRYERRKAIEHTTKFAKGGAKESRALINELLGLPKMKEGIAIQIADLMPKSPSEVRAIYAKERFTLTEAEIERILDCVAKYE
ncbi:MAG: RNA polymerase Rpb4 family protein [Candidatus Methanospirareceae archaeon]